MVVVKLLLTEPPQDKGSLGIYLVLCLVRGWLLPHSVKKKEKKKKHSLGKHGGGHGEKTMEGACRPSGSGSAL